MENKITAHSTYSEFSGELISPLSPPFPKYKQRKPPKPIFTSTYINNDYVSDRTFEKLSDLITDMKLHAVNEQARQFTTLKKKFTDDQCNQLKSQFIIFQAKINDTCERWRDCFAFNTKLQTFFESNDFKHLVITPPTPSSQSKNNPAPILAEQKLPSTEEFSVLPDAFEQLLANITNKDCKQSTIQVALLASKNKKFTDSQYTELLKIKQSISQSLSAQLSSEELFKKQCNDIQVELIRLFFSRNLLTPEQISQLTLTDFFQQVKEDIEWSYFEPELYNIFNAHFYCLKKISHNDAKEDVLTHTPVVEDITKKFLLSNFLTPLQLRGFFKKYDCRISNLTPFVSKLQLTELEKIYTNEDVEFDWLLTIPPQKSKLLLYTTRQGRENLSTYFLKQDTLFRCIIAASRASPSDYLLFLSDYLEVIIAKQNHASKACTGVHALYNNFIIKCLDIINKKFTDIEFETIIHSLAYKNILINLSQTQALFPKIQRYLTNFNENPIKFLNQQNELIRELMLVYQKDHEHLLASLLKVLSRVIEQRNKQLFRHTPYDNFITIYLHKFHEFFYPAQLEEIQSLLQNEIFTGREKILTPEVQLLIDNKSTFFNQYHKFLETPLEKRAQKYYDHPLEKLGEKKEQS